MAGSLSDDADRIRRDYVPAFLRYLARQDEAGLDAAYELGREAMRRSVGLLEVVRMHSEAYLDVVDMARDQEEVRQLARAASAFLLELVAAFEMAQRGFMEVGLRRTAPPGRPVEPPRQ